MDVIAPMPMQEQFDIHDRLGDELFADELVFDEHDLYPVHEEDSVPVKPRHFWQNNYMAYAIQMARPDVCVTSDTCLYWEKGNKHQYRAPDVAVIAGPPPDELPGVYLSWIDPPLLFVAEIGSRSTFLVDTGPKLEIYQQKLNVPEYLYTNHKGQILSLWRSKTGSYHTVPRDKDGKLWSEQLNVGFGFDEIGFLRVYMPDGQAIPTYEEAREEAQQAIEGWQQAIGERQSAVEAQQRAVEAQQRAVEERQRAVEERQRAVEAQQEAEDRAEREVLARQEADQHVITEVAARKEAERRTELESTARLNLEKQMAELTRRLEEFQK